MDEDTTVALDVQGPLARVTVGRGARHNAVGAPGWASLRDHLLQIGERDDVQAVLIGGRGGSFCAGSDITEWVGADTEAVEDSFVKMEQAFRAVEQCPVPVVAKVDGTAAGAGCQLALACDLRVMSASATIGMPIVRLGILTSPAFAARIIELAGPSVARELLYTGRLFSAQEAVAAGLTNLAVPDEELDARAEAMVERIVAQPPAGIRAAKQAVAAVLSPGRAATEQNGRRAVSEVDFQRGISEFLDR
jgi:enoyl-CoA hydratase/carnithine racemase